MRPLLLRAGLCAWLASLTGCGAARPPACEVPEQANLVVEATRRINPDELGRSLPTVVRVYQLKNLGNIELARFDEVWRQPEDTLGDTLLAADEVTVYPGRRTVRVFERDPNANFIVGVAIVRRPAGLAWRSILELPAPAEARRCAALQSNPEEAPPPAPVSRVEFRVDMYAIEGTVRLDSGSGDCALTDLECQRARAGATDVDAPEAPNTELPEGEVPETPDMPETPSMPETPQLPATPQVSGSPPPGAPGV